MELLKKKAPRYLFESRALVGSVIFVVLFSILFMLIYAPYSSTSWLTLMVHEREDATVFSGFRLLIASVTFYLVAIAFLILSKVVMYQVQRRHPFTNGRLALWVGGEVLMESFIYTVFTELFILTDPHIFFLIWGRAILVLSFILVVPNIICMQHATNRYQRALLDRIGMNVVNDKAENADPKFIHLIDNTGRLKMSINIDSLYYVESQDNYVKIYYEAEGKLCNYMLRSTTKAIESKFGEYLVRCHRGYIINKSKIKIFRNDRDGMYVRLMHDGIRQIPVSKSYAQNIQRLVSSGETDIQ